MCFIAQTKIFKLYKAIIQAKSILKNILYIKEKKGGDENKKPLYFKYVL